jgi:DNA-binding transcriptional regulator YbjK
MTQAELVPDEGSLVVGEQVNAIQPEDIQHRTTLASSSSRWSPPDGLRALTHARIDDRAGLPKGSTSNPFRTRAALLSGVVDWIVERELGEVDAAPSTASVAEFVDTLCGLIEYTTGTTAP